MVLAGGRLIAEIVVAGPGPAPCAPCGGCRQKLREFGRPDLLVRMVDAEGREVLRRTLAELLPDSFGPENITA